MDAKYWVRIAVIAGLIFGIGLLGWTMIRKGKRAVEAVASGSGPITIPLPFVPLQVDGADVGRFESVRIERSAPGRVQEVHLVVRSDDSGFLASAPACFFTAEASTSARDRGIKIGPGAHRLEESLTCLDSAMAATGGLEALGTVRILPADLVRPLVLPPSVVADIRTLGRGAPGAVDPAAEERRAVQRAIDRLGESMTSLERSLTGTTDEAARRRLETRRSILETQRAALEARLAQLEAAPPAPPSP